VNYIRDITSKLTKKGVVLDQKFIEGLESLISYSVASNLSQTKNDDLEPYLEAFLS
jgi:hypothetical protein